MKFVSVGFLLVLCFAIGSTAPVDAIRDLIIKLREQMPCGFPEYNLPPLAPLVLDTFEIKQAGLKLKVDDLRLDGLNSFEIDDLSFTLLLFKLGFRFTFRQIDLKTKYDLELRGLNIDGFGGIDRIFGNGDMDIGLTNLSFTGNLALQFHTGGSSSLKELKIGVDLESIRSKITGLMDNEIINDFINDLLISVVSTFVKDMKEFVSETFESLVAPLGNKLLENVTVKDIMDWINGGGSSKMSCDAGSIKNKLDFHY